MSLKQKRIEAWTKIEPQLQVADIILVRERSLLSRTVRGVTKSYWSHAVIVFAIPNAKTFFNNILVISAENGGIEIHRIQRYTKHFDYFDLGVKRVPGLAAETKAKVLSYVLNNVDIPYDYLRLFGFLLLFFLHRFRKNSHAHLLKRFTNENAFVCSSFIQKAFYEAVLKEKKDSVVFTEDSTSKFFLEEVTPADIARSKNCTWLYNPHN